MSRPSPQRALFVQPFTLGGNGGGARIFTSMIKGQPFDKRSINCDTSPGPALDWIEERHLAMRLELGRLSRTRFAWLSYFTEIAARPSFERKLADEIDAWSPNVVHVLPHWSYDFITAWCQARKRGCRVVMSAHDDVRYTLNRRHPYRGEALKMLGEIWKDADHVFTISEELGEEYSSRYGKRPYEIITDGLEKIPERPSPPVAGRMKVYFMGLFHYDYRENLRALTRALARLKSEQPGLDISLVMRCDRLERGIDSAFPARVLPFADHATLLNDMIDADLLYMPLPFGERHEAFTRYSLSTKMVTYLGGGVPILFHGPRDSAACRLLSRHGAALVCPSPDESEMIQLLKTSTIAEKRQEVVENALKLARTSFPLADLRQKFLKGLFP